MGLSLEDLQKVYPEGRRVRILPKSEESRAKVSAGVEEGIIREIMPVPAIFGPLDQDAPTDDQYGLQVEIVLPDGRTDRVILDICDIEPLPHDPS